MKKAPIAMTSQAAMNTSECRASSTTTSPALASPESRRQGLAVLAGAEVGERVAAARRAENGHGQEKDGGERVEPELERPGGCAAAKASVPPLASASSAATAQQTAPETTRTRRSGRRSARPMGAGGEEAACGDQQSSGEVSALSPRARRAAKPGERRDRHHDVRDEGRLPQQAAQALARREDG